MNLIITKKLPRSVRKYIRKEKARIRRESLSLGGQNELFAKLYQKFFPASNPVIGSGEAKIVAAEPAKIKPVLIKESAKNKKVKKTLKKKEEIKK